MADDDAVVRFLAYATVAAITIVVGAIVRSTRKQGYFPPGPGVVRSAQYVWNMVSTATRALTPQEVQAIVHERMIGLMLEFPGAGPEQIATMMRDEITVRCIQDPRFFWWATPETAVRLVRSAALQAVRMTR